MNGLIRKGLLSLDYYSLQQQKALIKTITASQMYALVQIVYNVLQGNRTIYSDLKKKLKRNKRSIRRFIGKGLTLRNRVKLLLKHFKSILLLVKVVEKAL